MYNLDVKNRKILHELDKNCRCSNAFLGRKVGLNKESVKYRIDNLLKNNVIVKFNTVINYVKLGYTKYKLYLRLKGANEKQIEEICEYCKGNGKTEWVVSCAGKWDIIISFIVHNINEFDEELQLLVNKFYDYIDEKAVTTTLYLAHHLRKFLADSAVKEDNIYHTLMDKPVEVENEDIRIIRILATNARMPVKEIAKISHLTPRIVQYRIKKMEKEKIILAYKAHLNSHTMGNMFCKAIISLRVSTNERLRKFIWYCSSLREAVWPQRVIGSWDFELDLEVESFEKFQSIMSDIREKFSDMIKSHEFIVVSREFKFNLFPECYPEMKGDSELQKMGEFED